MEKKKIALCGVRGHIDKFGRLINSYEESEAVAVWDPDYDTAKRVADLVGSCAVYTDYDALLAHPGLDAVVITYHNYMHRELAVRAARAGKAIFLEKPLAANLEDARAIRDAVREAGVKFFLTDPFVNNTTAYIKDVIASGELGPLQSVRIRFSNPGNALLGRDEAYFAYDGRVQQGGHISDTGGHPLHILHYLLGTPERVYAAFAYGSEAAKKHGYEQFEVLVLNYPGEVTAIIETGLISTGFVNCVEVCGTNGVIREAPLGDKGAAVTKRLLRLPESFAPEELRTLMNAGDWETIPAEDLGPRPDDHIRYFVRMLAYDLPNEGVGEDPLSLHGMSLDAGYELVRIMDAARRSAQEGRAVTLLD